MELNGWLSRNSWREYYDPPNPNINPPTCKMDLSGLLAYMVANGKKSGWELAKEEMKRFEQ